MKIERTAKFDLAEVGKLIEYAKANPGGYYPYTSEAAPSGLLLVKDDGCYLMANTDPRQTDEDGKTVVVYAEGLGSGLADYERVRAVCGGDDFAIFIGLIPLLGMIADTKNSLGRDPQTLGFNFRNDYLDMWFE